MDKKLIEEIIGRIIEIDRMANHELETINQNIEAHEKQHQSMIDEVQQNSHMLQVEEGKALYEEIIAEALREKETIYKDCLAKMNRMETEFRNEEEKILQKAIHETTIGKWGKR